MKQIKIEELPLPIQPRIQYFNNKEKVTIYECDSLQELYHIHLTKELVFDLAEKILDQNTIIESYATGYYMNIDPNSKMNDLKFDEITIYFYKLDSGNEYQDFTTRLKQFKKTNDKKIWWI